MFPTLRGFDGKPFGLGTSTRPVAGKVIVLVARGYTLLDDISVRAIFSEKDAFYSPRYPNNASLSAMPGFIVLHLDTDAGDLVLPSGAPSPGGRAGHLAALPRRRGLLALHHRPRSVPAPPGSPRGKTLPGEVYGFDIAGNIIDAYALALVLGFTLITSTRARPAGRERHAGAARRRARPAARPGRDDDGVDRVRPAAAAGDGRRRGRPQGGDLSQTRRRANLTVSFALEDDALDGVLPFGKSPYQFRHTRVGLWPGFGHALKTIKRGGRSS